MSKGTLEKLEGGAGMARCLFQDLRRSKRFRACKKCRARAKPFGGECDESGSMFEWWTAVDDFGLAVYFRCFPASSHLPRTPRMRYAYVRREYAENIKRARESVKHRYRDHPKRGVIWEVAATNALFSSLVGDSKSTVFRYATACEVAAWLNDHKDDILAMKDQEALISDLERYV